LYFSRENKRKVLENIKDAIAGYLFSLKNHNEPIPPSIEEEVVEVYA
jgi:predicted RNase H-like HicB family nuclease